MFPDSKSAGRLGRVELPECWRRACDRAAAVSQHFFDVGFGPAESARNPRDLILREVCRHLRGNDGGKDFYRVGMRFLYDRESAVDRSTIRQKQANDREQPQPPSCRREVVMHRDDARNVVELSQKLHSGFVVFEACDQIDMDEKWQVLKVRIAEPIEGLPKVAQCSTLKKHSARSRQQLAMGTWIPNDRDDMVSQAGVDRLSSHGTGPI